MKNTKNIKILLPLVILIWGFIIFKVVDVFRPDTQVMAVQKTTKINPLILKKRDTFGLLSIERDPFLGTLMRAKKVKKSGFSKTVTSVVEWPEIHYLGVVSDNKSNTAVYVLQVNGAQLLFKKGETQNDLKLLRGNASEVKLQFKNETKQLALR